MSNMKPETKANYTQWQKNKQYRILIQYVPGYAIDYPGSFNRFGGDFFQYQISHEGNVIHDNAGFRNMNQVKWEINQWFRMVL